MIAVTDRAAEELSKILDTVERGESQTLRLVPVEGGFNLELDQPRQDDQVVSHQGDAVLVIAQEVTSEMEDVTIDVQETPQGAQLTIGRT